MDDGFMNEMGCRSLKLVRSKNHTTQQTILKGNFCCCQLRRAFRLLFTFCFLLKKSSHPATYSFIPRISYSSHKPATFLLFIYIQDLPPALCPVKTQSCTLSTPGLLFTLYMFTKNQSRAASTFPICKTESRTFTSTSGIFHSLFLT